MTLTGFLSRDQEFEIYAQFQSLWQDDRQVMWSGMKQSDAQNWADRRELQTLSTALGPLKKHIPWSDRYIYMKGASTLFARCIARGRVVVLLTPPPPERFNPCDLSTYQTIEEPILKGERGNERVRRIMIVHPQVTGAQDFYYQYWPVDNVHLWLRQFGSITIASPSWRIVDFNETVRQVIKIAQEYSSHIRDSEHCRARENEVVKLIKPTSSKGKAPAIQSVAQSSPSSSNPLAAAKKGKRKQPQEAVQASCTSKSKAKKAKALLEQAKASEAAKARVAQKKADKRRHAEQQEEAARPKAARKEEAARLEAARQQKKKAKKQNGALAAAATTGVSPSKGKAKAKQSNEDKTTRPSQTPARGESSKKKSKGKNKSSVAAMDLPCHELALLSQSPKGYQKSLELMGVCFVDLLLFLMRDVIRAVLLLRHRV